MRDNRFFFLHTRETVGQNLVDKTMIPIKDGNSEINAHVRSNFCDLICLRHLIRSRESQSGRFFSKKMFLHTCATFSRLPFDTSSMDKTKLNHEDCTKHVTYIRWYCISKKPVLYSMNTI